MKVASDNLPRNISAAKAAVILVGRGSLYTAQPQEELTALSGRIRSSGFDGLVVDALLEQGEQSLPKALDACAGAGASKVIVVPAFLPVESATRNWLQFVARRWLRTSGSGTHINFASPLDAQQGIADAVLESIRQSLQSGVPLEPRRAVSERADPDWSVIPPHRYHVMFCQGPRCTTAGAGELGAYLRKRLKDRGLDWGEGHVLAARASCLYPCNLGPLMVVYPEGVWYCGLDEAAVDRIINEHFLGDKVVADHAYQPAPQRQALSGTKHPYS